jgi:ornithine cyclodeaminase/alanine dehydrogenase-like protein (mu-crystallin family)
MKTLIITKDDICKIIKIIGLNRFMDNMIEMLDRVISQTFYLRPDVRKREGFLLDQTIGGVLEWMPVSQGNDVTIKLVSYMPRNPTRYKIPTIMSVINLFDTETGHLVALADGIFLTAVRTGAASAIVSRVLALPESKVLGLIGCGSQAVTQLHALSRVFNFEKVYIYDTDTTAANSYIERASFCKLDIKIVERSYLEKEADIICTTTSVPIGEGPVLDGTFLKNHVHINSIGSDLPGKIELPISLLRNSFICPDFLPQALVEGECQQLKPSEIGPDITEVISNRDKYHIYRNQKTVFDSTGFALEDQVAMNLIVQYTKKYNLGQMIEIENISYDPLDPYNFIKQPQIIDEHSAKEKISYV